MTQVYHAVQLPLLPSKVCSRCNTEKFLSQFPKAPTCKDGYRTYCTACQSIGSRKSCRERYAENREQECQKQRDYYAANIDKKRESQRRRYWPNATYHRQRRRQHHIEHLEQDRQYRRTYYVSNTAYFQAKYKRWTQSNPLQRREKDRRYQARKQNATVGAVNYKRILERDGYICHICGQEIPLKAAHTDPKSLHFDHVIPLARGGTHSEENIRPSHKVCNLRKRSRLIEEMTPLQIAP